MNTARRPTPTSALLFALAGLAFLVSAFLNRDARGLIVGMQALVAVLFFLVAFVHYRRARSG